MAVNMKKIWNWFLLGAVGSLLFSLVLPFIIGLIVGQTGIEGFTFATYNVRSEFQALANNGNLFASWMLSMIGGGIQVPAIILSAVGMGALFAISVLLLEDMLGLKLGKTQSRIFWVTILSSVASGFIVAGNLPAFEWAPVVFLGVSGLLASYVLSMVHSKYMSKLAL